MKFDRNLQDFLKDILKDVEETGSEGPHPGHPLTELNGIRQKEKGAAEEEMVR